MFQLNCPKYQFEERTRLQRLEIKVCFLKRSWTKGCRHIHKIKENKLFQQMFYSSYFEIF